MHSDQLTNPPGGSGPRVGGCLHRTDIPTDDGSDQARVDLLPTYEYDVRCFHHRIGGLDHADQAARLDHAQRVANVTGRFISHLGY